MDSLSDRVLIVMPAFNEEANIRGVILEVKKQLPDVSILVINDGSDDRTTEVARSAGARVLDLPFNLGVGGAMRLGFRFAHQNNFSLVVQVDSDGQHDPASIPKLIEQLDKFDVVIGARFAGSGEYTVRGPRKWAMKLLAVSLSRALNAKLTDTTSGFKAHGQKAIAVFAREYPAEYLGDTIEALVIGHRAGLNFGQVPVTMRERAGGVPSHNAAKSAVYLGRAFFALMIAFLRPKSKKMVTS